MRTQGLKRSHLPVTSFTASIIRLNNEQNIYHTLSRKDSKIERESDACQN